MSVVINSNYAATIASNNLATSNAMLQRSLNRLSSGSKIVSPADDAGGLAVSMKLAAVSHRQAAVANNISNATSLLQTQDGALKITGKILDRMSELKTMSQDVTKGTSDVANYQTEFAALQTQLTAISGETFNGVSLFSSSALTVYTNESSTSTSVSLAGRDLASSSTGVGGLTGTSATLMGTALSTITDAIQTVATMRAANGAEQSRLGFAGELVTINRANVEAATSRIADVDVAEESTQLARWNILVQSGTAMLSQANQSAQSALRLLQ